MIGKVLGNRYEVLEKIGTGGMGDVYKAHDQKLDRIVAIKILKSEYNNDNNFIRKFKRESLAAASISHPNIVSIYDVGSEDLLDDKVHYIVMEFIDGRTLKEIINEEGSISEKRALNYTVQISEALKVAHSKGIVHRDIKSQNIMVTKDDRVKVTDFGIARVADNSTVTATNAIMGSVHYFSPEQARGIHVDNRSDIYSLGIVLYEMLTGNLPFDAENPVSVALMQVQSNMPKPSLKSPLVSSYTDEVVLKMTMKDPEDRYSDVFALIRDIKNIQLGRTGSLSYTGIGENSSENSPIRNVQEQTRKKVVRRSKEPEKRQKNYREEKKKNSFFPIVAGMFCALLIVFLAIKYIIPMTFSETQNDVEVETVLVPSIVGMNEDDAKKELEKYGLIFDLAYAQEDNNKTNGEIISQEPEKGTQVEKGSKISVVINRVVDGVKLPNFSGLTFDEAQKKAKEVGLVISNFEYEKSETVEKDKIVRQEPAAEQMISKDKDIVVYISSGKDDQPVKIPSVKGLSEKAAKDTLKKLGFEVEIEKIRANNVDPGEVSEYNPAGEAPKGSVIKLYVSEGFQEVIDTSDTTDEDDSDSEEDNSQNLSLSTSDLPTVLTLDLPNDDSRHRVVVWRYPVGKDRHKVFDYNKDSSEGTLEIPCDYLRHGDKIEFYIDDKLVKTENF